MWAPCLYDHWQDSKKQYSITSFAIITDDPPKEILEKGHDRCPIFLSEKFLDSWLNPNQRNINEVLDILKNKEETFFESNFL